MFRRSIFVKIVSLFLASIIILTIGTCMIASVNLEKESLNSAGRGMNLICQTEGQELNEILDEISQSVDYLSGMSAYTTQDINQLISSKEQRDRFAYLARENFSYLSRHTKGDVAFWLVFDYTKTNSAEGFYYAKTKAADTTYKKRANLDVKEMTEKEAPWYYQAYKQKKGVWQYPYENDENETIITYSAPIMINDDVIAVIGIDVDYPSIINYVKAVSVNQKGYAFLLDKKGELLAHPHLDYKNFKKNYAKKYNLDLSKEETHDTNILNYEVEGVSKYMAYRTLPNGMKFVVCDTEEEIMIPKEKSLRTVVSFVLIITAILIFIVIIVTDYTVRPLIHLALTAERITQGDLDATIKVKNIDEVGRLAKSFSKMTDKLKEDLRVMESMAYKDGLTQVGNKIAYNEMIEKLDKQIEDNTAEFGVVMCDVNELKRVNDEYGHEAGDELILTACKKICDIFKHSPVYRIGGDEFVVILQKEDYHNSKEHIKELSSYNKPRDYSSSEPQKQICIASGLSIYTEKDQSYQDVFVRADEAMYKNKKLTKKKPL